MQRQRERDKRVETEKLREPKEEGRKGEGTQEAGARGGVSVESRELS